MMNRYQIVNLIRKSEIIIASVVVIFALIAGSILFLRPNFNRAKLIYEQKSQLQKKLDKLKQKDNALSDLDSKYYQGALTRFYRILPDGKDYVSLFETLDGLEKKTNVKILRANFPLGSLSGGKTALGKLHGESAYILPVTVDVQGDFSSIEKYLEALTDLSGRIITVDSISMKMDQKNVYTLSLSGNAFLVPPPGTIGSLDSPIPKINNAQQELLDKIAKIKTTYQTTPQEKVSTGRKNLFD